MSNPDQWTRSVPLTEEGVANLRQEAVKTQNLRLDIKLTCDDCSRANVCTLAFDQYNTDGDCLYDK
jgi:hypothetical protein